MWIDGELTMFHIPAHKNLASPAAQFDAPDGPKVPSKGRTKGKRPTRQKANRMVELAAKSYLSGEPIHWYG